jgi:hypothetical protein
VARFPGTTPDFLDIPLSRRYSAELPKRLRQFRRQQRGRAIVRRDICAESTSDFQNTLVIDSARESNHKSCHERIAGADRVFHFYVWRRRSR